MEPSMPCQQSAVALLLHHDPPSAEMGVQASEELSAIVLEACEAAEQAGEQQVDEYFQMLYVP